MALRPAVSLSTRPVSLKLIQLVPAPLQDRFPPCQVAFFASSNKGEYDCHILSRKDNELQVVRARSRELEGRRSAERERVRDADADHETVSVLCCHGHYPAYSRDIPKCLTTLC
ncbi:hypothetical protein BD309DRAFT_216026 [Dichomitus squalens]|nr:hypothetical protein BD309DRAFT_216026 [Dichomitus squalens]